MNLRKTALSAAVLAAVSVAPASAAVVTFDWSGNFTMLTNGGSFVQNVDAKNAELAAYYAGEPYVYVKGNRTPISGTMTFNTVTGAGTGTVGSFDFFEGGAAVPHDITMQAIGNGFGTGPGNLILGNMLFDWGGNNNIAVEVILDGSGLFAAMPGMFAGTAMTVDQASCAVAGSGCVEAASENTNNGTPKNPEFFPMGAIPVATTTYNVNNAGTAIGGGTFSTDDGVTNTAYADNDDVAGTPMDNGPFIGFNASFDMMSVTMTGCLSECGGPAEVPVPAAVWLFGSGLVGLAGVARRRKQA